MKCKGSKPYPPITLSIYYQNFTILNTTYLQSIDGVWCQSLLVGDESMDQAFLMGNAFLRQFYTVFDFGAQRIGWSNAVRSFTGTKGGTLTSLPTNA